MAGSASDYLENKVADLLFGGTAFTPPATYYLALLTAAGTEAGGFTEVTGGGYARKAITNNKTNFSTASGGVVNNAVDIEFTASSGAQSAGANITHAVLMDASSGGNMISGPIDLPAAINITAANQVVRFLATQLTFTVS